MSHKHTNKSIKFKLNKTLAFILAADIALTGAALINKGTSKKHDVINIESDKYISETLEPEETEEVVKVSEPDFVLEEGYAVKNDLVYFDWGEVNGFSSASLLNISTVIDGYQIARQLATNGEFSLVELEDGSRVYVTNQCFKSLPDSEFVVVDLSDQTLYVYDNEQIVYSTPVVTGSDENPTTPGYYPIWCKHNNYIMSGSYGDYYCDYALGVTDVTYIHDAEIHECENAYHVLNPNANDNNVATHGSRSVFGGDEYHNNGSHKCINTTNEAGKYLYENIDVGDMVLIKK